MPYRKVTGAWVDGVPVPVGDAGRSLSGFLSEADFVTVVVADGHSVPHTVSFSGTPARHIVDLTMAATDGVNRTTDHRPLSPDDHQ